MPFKVQVQAYDAGANTADSSIVTTNYPPPATIGTPGTPTASVPAFGQIDVSWPYTTQSGDTLTHFLIYVGTDPTPNFSGATEYAAGSITTSYGTSIFVYDYGTVYIAVRASGPGGTLTSDSSTISIDIAEPEPVNDITGNIPITRWAHQLITGSTTPDAIRDINVINSAHDSVDITYAVQTDTPTEIEAGIYVDGALVGRVPASHSAASATTLAPGTHSLEVLPLRVGQRAPQRQGYTIGDRVYLQWDASTSPYLSHYNIYRDGVLIGQQDERQVYPLDFYATSAGGRVSVFGYPSTDINTTLPVTVSADTFTFDGEIYNFVTGSPVSLPYGVMVIFHDDPGEYTSFDIFIGVRNTFITDSQAAGTYTYSVEAVDTAGNFSTQLAKTITVIPLPSIPTVNNTQITGGVDISYINIYSDYNAVFGTHDPYINTSAPAQTIFPTGEGFIDPVDLPVGSRFYAWPVRDEVELEVLTIHAVIDPLAPIAVLSVPADVSLTPAVDGNMTVEFTYRFATDDGATLFRIFYGTDPNSFVANITLPTSAGTGGAVKLYSTTLPALYATGITVYVQVRAESSTVEGELSDIASATAVADDPLLTGVLYGVQT